MFLIRLKVDRGLACNLVCVGKGVNRELTFVTIGGGFGCGLDYGFKGRHVGQAYASFWVRMWRKADFGMVCELTGG